MNKSLLLLSFAVLFCLVFASSVSAFDWTTGVVHYYKLDNNDLTDSLSTLNGTNSGSTNVSGIINSARNFSGSTSVNFSSSNFQNVSVFYSLWIRPTNVSCSVDPGCIIYSIWADSGNAADYISIYNSEVKYVFGNQSGSNNVYTTSGSGINTSGSWFNIIINGSGNGGAGRYQIYINGINQTNMTFGSAGTARARATGASTKSFFAWSWTPSISKLYGTLDEFMIGNKTLITQDISDLYNGGIGVPYSGASSGLTVTLISPANNVNVQNSSQTFNCNATTNATSVSNLTINIWNSTEILTYNLTNIGASQSGLIVGNMWVANYNDNTVTKIMPNGTMKNCTGLGTNPYGIATDNFGNEWTANTGASSVSKVFPNCTVTTYSGTGVHPIEIAYDGENMWTADASSNGVTKVFPNGTMTRYTGTGSFPQSLTFCAGNIWTANEFADSVTKVFINNGTMTTYYGTGSWPFSMGCDGTNVWTVDLFSNSTTKVFTSNGTMTIYYGLGAFPGGIAYDNNGAIWTDSIGTNGYSAAGMVTKVFINNGTMTNYSGTGIAPVLIAFDGANMWTANSLDNSVTKVFPNGTMTNYSGTGAEPNGIAFDAATLTPTFTPIGNAIISNFSLNLPYPDVFKWNCLAMDSSGASGWAVSNYTITFALNVSIINETFSNETLEQGNSQFNITINQSDSNEGIIAQFVYNGTWYNPDGNITNGSNITFYKTVNSRYLTNGNLWENKSFNWVFNLTLGGIYGTVNSTSEQQTVHAMTLVNLDTCNSTYPYQVYNLSYADELLLTPVPFANNSWNYSLSNPDNSTFSRIYSSFANKSTHNFCSAYINSIRYFSIKSVFSQIDANSYFSRKDMLCQLGNGSSFVNTLYLLNSSNTDYLNFYFNVKDQSQAVIPNAFIYFEKQTNNIWEYLGGDVTDTYGNTVFRFIPNFQYRITVKDSNCNVLQVSTLTLECQSQPCTNDIIISSQQNPYNPIQEIPGFNWTMNYYTSSGNVNMTYIDSQNQSSYVQYIVYQRVLSTGDIQVCSNTSYLSYGTMACNIGAKTGSFIGYLHVHRADGSVFTRTYTFDTKEAVNNFGKEGLLWAVLIIITLFFIGSYNPVVGIVLAVVGVIIMALVGFISFPWLAIVFLAVVGIIIIIKLKS